MKLARDWPILQFLIKMLALYAARLVLTGHYITAIASKLILLIKA